MALVNNKDIHQDAVLITEAEAITKQWELIQEWKPKTDVWALSLGSVICGSICGITGFYVNGYYRRKLKLGKYGHTTSYLPMVILPTLFGGIFHFEVVTSKIIIKKDKCEVCTEMRALALQGTISLIYPLILGPAINYFLASNYNTIRIPIINREPKKMWEFHKITSKRMYTNGSLIYLSAIQILASTLITYFEYKNFYSLEEKLKNIERDMIAKGIVFQ